MISEVIKRLPSQVDGFGAPAHSRNLGIDIKGCCKVWTTLSALFVDRVFSNLKLGFNPCSVPIVEDITGIWGPLSGVVRLEGRHSPVLTSFPLSLKRPV